MKKQIKKSNRHKAIAGAIVGAAGIGALTNIFTSLIGANRKEELSRAQEAKENIANNANLESDARINFGQAANNRELDELALERTNNISTINNQFCFGGKRRMKRCGGNISANVKGLGRYI